ncbi:unnamed protein product [Allacma fusca]|uniref:Uncharacterized protein n=1 Tax=Allacma fusca TaxID=39272 RepID=A0A8J2PAX2_9HEXA|nr:unnamed protein product [Allacma fusca]
MHFWHSYHFIFMLQVSAAVLILFVLWKLYQTRRERVTRDRRNLLSASLGLSPEQFPAYGPCKSVSGPSTTTPYKTFHM